MAAEHTTFSTSGEDAITRTIDVEVDTATKCLSSEEFDDFYDIQRTAEEIVASEYKKIALQFPDSLLHDSVPIYRRLKSRIGGDRELYVLADTSYGSCCVDEVAAEHADADALVHYGYACMTLSSRLPVIYVFGKKPLDVEDCVTNISELVIQEKANKAQEVILKHDVAFTHLMDKLLEKLREKFEPNGISLRYDPIPTTTRPPTQNPQYLSSPKDDVVAIPSDIIYIGEESLGLTNLLMTHGSSQVYSYDPKSRTSRLESSRTNKMLMKRYAAVQKARDSDVFGILVGTLGVASYLPLIKHIRALLSRKQKKSYTISVGKLNPAKLANFLEIECFILVACPENSVVDSKEFLRPIVTPFELEIALHAEMSWTGRYILNFEQLLRGHATGDDALSLTNGREEGEESEDPDRPEFSLVTGKYRHAKRYGEGETVTGSPTTKSSSVILRNAEQAIAVLQNSAAGQFLQARTYQGLDPRLGEDEPGELEQGRSGIAKGYEDDLRSL